MWLVLRPIYNDKCTAVMKSYALNALKKRSCNIFATKKNYSVSGSNDITLMYGFCYYCGVWAFVFSYN